MTGSDRPIAEGVAVGLGVAGVAVGDRNKGVTTGEPMASVGSGVGVSVGRAVGVAVAVGWVAGVGRGVGVEVGEGVGVAGCTTRSRSRNSTRMRLCPSTVMEAGWLGRLIGWIA